MQFFQTAQNPWGQEVLIRISWNLLYLSALIGALFIIGHLVWRATHKEAEAAVKTSAPTDVPEKVLRHSLAARLFHWVMAAAVLVLLFTGFLPVLGVQFSWVTIHWVAGLVFLGTIVFHVIHTTFWTNLRDMWISASDWKEWWQEVKHNLGNAAPPPRKPGKYPIDHRIFHHLSVLTGLGVIVTGIFMMYRIETPLFTRNPYFFSDSTWGLIYVLHGLSAVALVGMTMAHIYFAVLPEKRWLTISMIAGWITRKDFLENHDPERWAVSKQTSSAPSEP